MTEESNDENEQVFNPRPATACRNRKSAYVGDDLVDQLDDRVFREQVKRVDVGYAQHYLAFRFFHGPSSKTSLRAEATHVREYVDCLSTLETTVKDASVSQVDRFLTYYLDAYDCSGTTLRTIIESLQRLYGHLNFHFEELDCLTASQIHQLKGDYDLSRRGFPRVSLSKSEIHRLLGHADPGRDKLMLQLAYQVALENGEVRGLRRLDFDPDDRTLTVSNPSRGRDRCLPLLAATAERLDRWLEAEWENHASGDSEVLFQSREGSPQLSKTQFYRIVNQVAERAGLQESVGELARGREKRRVTPSVLRRSGIDHWKDDGLPDEVVERLLGRGHSISGANEVSHFEMYRDRFDPPSTT